MLISRLEIRFFLLACAFFASGCSLNFRYELHLNGQGPASGAGGGGGGGGGPYTFSKFGVQFGQNYPGLFGYTGIDDVQSLTVDSSGNKIVVGSTDGDLGGVNQGGTDIYVSKIDSSGNLLWIRQFSPAYSALILDATGWDRVNGVAVDSSDNIYVAGLTTSNLAATNGGGGNEDAWVAKLNPGGTLVWIKQFVPSYSALILDAASTESANDIKIDSSGNLYIIGNSGGGFASASGGAADIIVAKIDSGTGTLTWLKQLTPAYSGLIGNAGAADYGASLSLDSSANIYITGKTAGSLGGANAGGDDGIIAKINTAGVLQWIHQFVPAYSTSVTGGSANDQPSRISTDPAGNSYVVGYTFGDLFGDNEGGPTDAFVLKVDTTGALLWGHQLTSDYDAAIDASNLDFGVSVSLDGLDQPYIAVTSYGPFAGANPSGNIDSVLAKLSSTTGSIVWMQHMNDAYTGVVGSTANHEQIRSIFTDTDGNTCAAGQAFGNLFDTVGVRDVYVLCTDPTGSLL